MVLQIQATIPHHVPQVREPSGCNRHFPMPEPGLHDYCYHESRQPCGIPAPRGASPWDVTDITLRWNQASRSLPARIQSTMPTFPTACPPWPWGQEGRPALRTAPPAIARANGQRARNPNIGSVLRCTKVSEPAEGDTPSPKPDSRRPDYCYYESQLALLLNRWGEWAP